MSHSQPPAGVSNGIDGVAGSNLQAIHNLGEPNHFGSQGVDDSNLQAIHNYSLNIKYQSPGVNGSNL